ncbi:uncharacterized protein LOC134837696 [Culicoides brevitarsis]|uniref:uncharacterized protein LOC134837696 n=1 Tax=Culicoides brevitarsis TaxID=469753 RepID=UPI00307B548C
MSDKKFSKDELVPPKWLNEEFLVKVLKHHEKCDEIQVNELIISPGTAPGEHFASIMFKIDVSYEFKDTSKGHSKFILKTLPVEEGVKMDFLKDSTAFPTEIYMYEEILPKMHALLREKGDDTVFAPELVYHTDTPSQVIILKDLTPDGFRTYENPLEMEAAKVITEKLAKFHACSVFLNENGTPIDSMTDSYVKPAPGKPRFADEWMSPGLKLAISHFSKWEGCEKIVEKLIECQKTFADRFTEVFVEPNGQAYKVLNHGDFHFKNLMYRNDGKVAQDLLMIDFQFCFFGTPAVDFISMLCQIVDKKVRDTHRDEIQALYFETFVATLKLLDFKGKFPTLEDFDNEIKRCGFLEFALIICYGAYFYLDWREADIMAAMETNDPYGPTVPVWEKNEEWKEYVTKFVEDMINKGFLD